MPRSQVIMLLTVCVAFPLLIALGLLVAAVLLSTSGRPTPSWALIAYPFLFVGLSAVQMVNVLNDFGKRVSELENRLQEKERES